MAHSESTYDLGFVPKRIVFIKDEYFLRIDKERKIILKEFSDLDTNATSLDRNSVSQHFQEHWDHVDVIEHQYNQIDMWDISSQMI